MTEQTKRPPYRMPPHDVTVAIARLQPERGDGVADCYRQDSIDALEDHIAALEASEQRLVEALEPALTLLCEHHTAAKMNSEERRLTIEQAIAALAAVRGEEGGNYDHLLQVTMDYVDVT
jgi:hypothetical protein